MKNEAGKPEQDHFESLTERLEINMRYYSEEDPANKTLSIFAEAALKALDEPHFRQLLEDVFLMRPELPMATTVKLLERVFQADALQHDPANYPYRTVPEWLDHFSLVNEDFLRGGVVWHSLMHRNLQSNIAERYKSVKLMGALLEDRFERPPTHLDVGSSVLHGDIKLAFNDVDVPFGPIEIVKPTGEHSYERDQYFTKLANIALKQQVQFGSMVGVDITNVDDPVTRQWVKSCSFYPDELLDENKVREYKVLDELDPNHERVQVFRGDFANLDFKAFREVSPAEGYDIITFSTIFYQVETHERVAMLVNASQLLSDRGIIIIQDGIGGDFSKNYNYVTSVIDSTARHPSEQVILRWEKPRCQRAALGMGRFSLGGKLHTFGEALEKRFGNVAV